MHARVTTLDLDPGKVDEASERLQSEDLPKFQELDGFKGMTLLTDRDSGKTVAVSFWESEDTLSRSEEAVKDARQRAADAAGAAGPPQVERFEVLFDTMA